MEEIESEKISSGEEMNKQTKSKSRQKVDSAKSLNNIFNQPID